MRNARKRGVAVNLFLGRREKNAQLGNLTKSGGLIAAEGLEAGVENGDVSTAGVEQVWVGTGVSFD
jgi:hypothetical protein